MHMLFTDVAAKDLKIGELENEVKALKGAGLQRGVKISCVVLRPV